MKFKLSILFIVVVISSGCSNYFSAHKNGGFQSNSKKIIAKGSLKKDSDLLISKENRGIEDNLIDFQEEANLSTMQNAKIAQEIENQNSIIIHKPFKNHTRVYTETNECDEIICKNGEIIKAKIIEISEDNIRYRMCPENKDRPSYSILKSKVLVISYKNGEKEVIKQSENYNQGMRNSDYNYPQNKPSSNSMSILSLIFGIISVLGIIPFFKKIEDPYVNIIVITIGLILSLLSILFGVLHFLKIRNLKNDPIAISGIVIGSIVFLILLILSLMILF
jgi:heme/copper-type cytochrome/quinol oxidase subunit 4